MNQPVSHPIRQSYARIAPKAPDVIAELYRRLFTRLPETRSLFQEEMGNQYGKFAATLELCVMAEDDPLRLDAVLTQMKARHGARGVQAAHYPVFIDCFVEAMADQIGADWTSEHDAAWRRALGAIAEKMVG